MSAPWSRIKLGEVISHRKEFVTIDDLKTYTRLRVQLHAQGVVPRDEIPGALIKTKQQQVCRSGDFLVAEIDAKVGGFGMVPRALDGSIVSSHYFPFTVNDTKLDRRFLRLAVAFGSIDSALSTS
jgi:type I restriction enzyme S subunit